MSRKFEQVLLIDDSEADNFFHRISIENTGLAGSVECRHSAESALDYLDNTANADQQMPDIIFVDINMPAVDGWEFLQRYEQQLPAPARTAKLFVVSTSLNPADRERALANPLVSGYVSKPLDSKTFSALSEDLLLPTAQGPTSL